MKKNIDFFVDLEKNNVEFIPKFESVQNIDKVVIQPKDILITTQRLNIDNTLLLINLNSFITSRVSQKIDFPYNYSVEAVKDYKYSFSLNSDGFYESTNKGINSSTARCKVSFEALEDCFLQIDYIISSEVNYDYGIIYELNSTTNKLKDLKGVAKGSYSMTTNISTSTNWFYIDYKKDNSSHVGNDSFQFKISFWKYKEI